MFRSVSKRLKERLKGKASGEDANAIRIRRRRALSALLWRRLPIIIRVLFIVGFLWMLFLPSSKLSRGTYIDENALQPAQEVTTYWNWDDVHRADLYLGQLETWSQSNLTSMERATVLASEFKKLGIVSSTQSYTFRTATETIEGVNAYAVFSSPRASGAEAMVVSASWVSRTGEGDGTLNLRGIATVLALAAFLKEYSLWAKDIIFVVSDGYMDGMHAWLSAYHGSVQSNLDAEPLDVSSGVIWTALNIDYPGHSFSHLGVFFEGLNGRLPNQDLLNSFGDISRRTGGVPVLVYDHIEPREFPAREFKPIPSWLPDSVKSNEHVKEYAYHAKNIARHVGYQSRGMASGVHGLFHRFRIDAITLFAVPATGPHGFHAVGRILESTLRTTNNLLERLHASFFFYILVAPQRFMKIGSYLPSAVLISVAMMFAGLAEWINAGWYQDDISEKSDSLTPVWRRRSRPVLNAMIIMLFTHVLGAMIFFTIIRSWILNRLTVLSPVLLILVGALPPLLLRSASAQSRTKGPLCTLLKSLNLCLASTVISITSVLNFSLAAALAILLGPSLYLSSPSQNSQARIARYIAYVYLGFGWMVLAPNEIRSALWNWEILGVWFAPFVCLVYGPLVLQAGIVCLLHS